MHGVMKSSDGGLRPEFEAIPEALSYEFSDQEDLGSLVWTDRLQVELSLQVGLLFIGLLNYLGCRPLSPVQSLKMVKRSCR
jgi:hypothetical protein